MENIHSRLTVGNASAGLVVLLASVAVYRIFFHPLAGFPGPRLAAITRYYEGYFDVVEGGRYTFKIAELHKKYGPIVRISPHELHVSAPEFFDTIYCQDVHLDKYDWAYDAFATKGAAITSAAHHVHRARRQPLAPFFSQAKVANRQDLVRRHLSKLQSRFSKFAKADKSFNLSAAMTALTRDIATDFILNKSYNILDHDDFGAAQEAMLQSSGAIWRLSKFIRFLSPSLQALPLSWLIKIADRNSVAFVRYLRETQNQTKELMDAASSHSAESLTQQCTIVHEIMHSNLPLAEKSFQRVWEEVATTTGAGFETTSGVLRLVLYHVYSDDQVLRRLRQELFSASMTRNSSMDWKSLEQLPYLSAILHEGLRLSPSLFTRMARISPQADIQYEQWHIPAGTPVGMTIALMHQDPTIWPEPKQFKPERWLGADGTLRRINKGFAPFSRGTRSCLGMHLAWAEMYLALAGIVQRFDLLFPYTRAADFEAVSDNFIGIPAKRELIATVAEHVA